jgi:hypothetical protein
LSEAAGGEVRIPALSATIPTVPGYTMLGARAGYTLPHWAATVYVDNLTISYSFKEHQPPWTRKS